MGQGVGQLTCSAAGVAEQNRSEGYWNEEEFDSSIGNRAVVRLTFVRTGTINGS
jgi:hypothetical protein